MILLDTCALIFDPLTLEWLTPLAPQALERGEAQATLPCADIALSEVAMLVGKGRLDPRVDSVTFCRLALDARGVRVLPIPPEIAWGSIDMDLPHGDPADRLIAATANGCGAVLVTSDEKLRESSAVATLW